MVITSLIPSVPRWVGHWSLAVRRRRPGILYNVNNIGVYLEVGRGSWPKGGTLRPFHVVFVPSVKFVKQKTYCLVSRTKNVHTKCLLLIGDNTRDKLHPLSQAFFLDISQMHKRQAYKIFLKLNSSLFCVTAVGSLQSFEWSTASTGRLTSLIHKMV